MACRIDRRLALAAKSEPARNAGADCPTLETKVCARRFQSFSWSRGADPVVPVVSDLQGYGGTPGVWPGGGAARRVGSRRRWLPTPLIHTSLHTNDGRGEVGA